MRPGMYIGSTDTEGLHHLVWEAIDNAVDEIENGGCRHIVVVLHSDRRSVTVADDGRGIPCGVHPQTGVSTLETVFTKLHAGGKFAPAASQSVSSGAIEGASSSYAFAGGLHGVGSSVINALSAKLHVASGPESVPDSGTCLTFQFDTQVFGEDVLLEGKKIERRLKALAYLHPTASFQFFEMPKQKRRQARRTDSSTREFHENEVEEKRHGGPTLSAQPTQKEEREEGEEGEGKEEEEEGKEEGKEEGGEEKAGGNRAARSVLFREPGGLDSYIRHLSANLAGLFTEEPIISIPTPEGGVHIEGIRAALSKAVHKLLRLSSAEPRSPFLAKASAKKDGKRGKSPTGDAQTAERTLSVQGEFLREGLVGVVSLKMREAQFEGQTKKKLGNKKVKGIVEELVADGLLSYFESHPQNLQKLLQKAAAARAAAVAAKAARDFARAKQQSSTFHLTLLPGKLADCSPTNAQERLSKEIFIVEGESAAGSAKQARDRRTQAILPLRGKILNVEKLGNFGKIFENEELKALIAALGISMTKTGEVRADLDGLRYSRVIILTDADVDGAHIRSLLLTFFFRLQPELFRQSRIFVACPPLFKISHFPVPRKLLNAATAAQSDGRASRAAAVPLRDAAEGEQEEEEGQEEKGEKEEDEERELGRAKRLVTETYVWTDEEVEQVLQVLRTYREGRPKTKETKETSGAWRAADVVSGAERGDGDVDTAAAKSAGPGALREDSKTLPGVTLQRFKGLGEMQPEQLRRTTMSPATRILKRISVADAQEAEAVVASLMGDDVEARKKIISEASSEVFVEDLDV
ncbi:hypothetical protein NCLIV_006680 [Neospora caninum Liverpool]|uniref:DNA topoisomerase 2 n=1 Tax=Neospora caninum (strain Liverpool) TaxID=572307 RepID=F0V902_NEOCL|nr:hypothetical protein NCLIV_006680 [Neospora caninum Liverpool]CBZ50193.1 hypothetical protein NCLIV_006680 [Neospora caninum Liverpool]|eukprot:XP_003880228.1 hypothetical protein NCLIV_006680 [Neospora caninum Liverpool]